MRIVIEPVRKITDVFDGPTAIIPKIDPRALQQLARDVGMLAAAIQDIHAALRPAVTQPANIDWSTRQIAAIAERWKDET